MIEISTRVSLDESEIVLEFVRASGPGGQNVNKVASAAQLRFDVLASPSLTADVKERLMKLAGSRVTAEGVLLIEAKRYRTQERNRQDAIDRLTALIQRALEPPRPRKATRPSAAVEAARLDAKRKRSQVKRRRQAGAEDWD
jgi:ribosome-associated protein